MPNRSFQFKKIIFARIPLTVFSKILILFFYFISVTSAQWTNQNPVPEGSKLNDVYFVNEYMGWAVGNDGLLIRTTNSGLSWFGENTGVLENLNSVFFYGEYEGYIAGDNGTLLKSTNKGREWSQLNFPYSANLESIEFLNSSEGLTVSFDGNIFRTSDGGEQWSLVSEGQLMSLEDISFANDEIALAAGKGILRSANNGASWIEADSINLISKKNFDRTLFSIQMIDSLTGYACGNQATMLKTTDGGKVWNQILTGFSSAIYYSVSFTDSQNGIAVGDKEGDGFIIRTTDGGLSWEPYQGLKNLFNPNNKSNPLEYYYFKLFAISNFSGSGFSAVGSNGIVIRTEDYGNSWLNLFSGTTDYINEIYFTDAMNGWAVGGFYAFSAASGVAKIYKTTNGGASWISTYKSTGIANELFFINEKVGYVTLFNLDNSLLKTTDAGNSWITLAMPSFPIISSIYFTDEFNGWAVGDYGFLFKTTDAGLNWSEVNTGSGSNFHSIFFTDPSTGYIAGDAGTVLKTTNGGINWESVYPSSNASFRDIYFIGNKGWTAGQKDNMPFTNGIISTTTNGGVSWSEFEAVNALNSVSFSNELLGMSVGENGEILHTLDGGNSWYSDSQNFNSYLTSVYYHSSNLAFVSGYNGLILKYKGFQGWAAGIDIFSGSDLLSGTSLTFGQHPQAEDGIDTGIGEASLTPLLPGNFGARFLLPSPYSQQTKLDLRDTSKSEIDWNVIIQAGSNTKITISWNPENLPDGSFRLKTNSNQKYSAVDMKKNEILVIDSVNSAELVIEYRRIKNSSIEINEGWNLLSVPLLSEDMQYNSLFPNSTSNPFSFNNGYQIDSLLQNGKGYWLKFNSASTIELSGINNSDTIALAEGWNLIAPFEKSVPVSNITTIPDGIIQSSFFGFSNSYNLSGELLPGKGYWVKSSQSGKLILNEPSNSLKANYSAPASYAGKIIFTDAEGKSAQLIVSDDLEFIETSDLPPIPPNGIFDARFSNGKFAEQLKDVAKSIIISSAKYPVAIRTEGIGIKIKDAINGGIISAEINSGGEFIIDQPISKFLISEISQTDLPISYQLHQNFPNPFNPSTKIRFDLPAKTNVILNIYNLTGELIETLVNKELAAGIYEYEFNAEIYASGIYIASFRSDQFKSIRKMMLLK